ncbi:glycosyl transferase [Pullulanibacillus camelliae]|uniref:Glycosyl transferase n=1 Tax=Pullulanibacillus camelliae TaxID=1707096 RepID=A0A8J2YPB6_9BACL|nr:glycosyltransferase [Pullulanibacillus camelliae]GGE56693.1 glycosyl transferase [Pullulanibacillus camelliae]
MSRKLRLLLYGDVDLNIMDGSAVWLTSMANVLHLDPNITTDVLLKARIKTEHLITEIQGLDNVRVIDPFSRFASSKFVNKNRLQRDEAISLIEELNAQEPYDCIILRGLSFVIDYLKQATLLHKTIPYITDFTHDPKQISETEREELRQIYQSFPNVFVQTEQMGELLKQLIDCEGKKFSLLYPMIPKPQKEPNFKNTHDRLVYSGKFAADWYTEEILNAFARLAQTDSGLTLSVVGDKFQGDLVQKKDEILRVMKEADAIHWYGAVARHKSLEIIRDADLGICWRSERIDHDESVELSTKLLEYGQLGKPVLLRRTKMYEELLGSDYFLFVDNEAEWIEKTLRILNDSKLYRQTARRVYERTKKFTFNEAYERLRPLLWHFCDKKINLVFAGHDLKFIQAAITHFEQHPNVNVRIDQWSGHDEHDSEHSTECLEWADVIFCEWGLGNAVWYSQNKKKGQKLFVRMHLQERETSFPSQFHLENIDQIIVISPYIFEEFHRVCQIPREKMIMIYNMIDTNKFNKTKIDNTQVAYHLGICGILPKRKRLDRALDILEQLWKKDHRYKLFVKGKLPEELKWLMKREDEKQYYDAIFARIKQAPWGKNVIFDEHGNDMDEWFRKIGYILSTSDFESFHLAPMEGLASASLPAVWHWTGAETIYPKEFLFENDTDIVDYILKTQHKLPYHQGQHYVQKTFDKKRIIEQIEELVLS